MAKRTVKKKKKVAAKKKVVAKAKAKKAAPKKKKPAPKKKPAAKTRVVTSASSTVDVNADETTQLPLFDASETQAVPAQEVVGEIEEQLALGKLTES